MKFNPLFSSVKMMQPNARYQTPSANQQPTPNTLGYCGYWRFTYFAYFYFEGNSSERALPANRTT